MKLKLTKKRIKKMCFDLLETCAEAQRLAKKHMRPYQVVLFNKYCFICLPKGTKDNVHSCDAWNDVILEVN